MATYMLAVEAAGSRTLNGESCEEERAGENMQPMKAEKIDSGTPLGVMETSAGFPPSQRTGGCTMVGEPPNKERC